MDLALIIDDTINQYKHKTPMPLKSKFKKIFDDAWGKAHLMQMEDLPAEEKYAFSLFYKKANDTMTDEEKETTDSVTVNEILPETVDGDGGCPFYGRCRYAGENCLSEVPTLTDIGTPGHPHLVRCERIAYGEKYTAAD